MVIDCKPCHVCEDGLVKPIRSSATEGRTLETASWDNCRADFAFDGALVDLLAPGTGPAEWEVFWAALRLGPFGLWGYRDGEPWPLPETAAVVFAEREVAAVTV